MSVSGRRGLAANLETSSLATSETEGGYDQLDGDSGRHRVDEVESARGHIAGRKPAIPAEAADARPMVHFKDGSGLPIALNVCGVIIFCSSYSGDAEC